MKVGIIQSNYIPWRGYFDIIDEVDLFLFHDDLQYTKNDWRNRNKIKTKKGAKWLTVPVKYKKVNQLIKNTEIDYSQNWQKKHINLIKENYSKATFFKQISEEFFGIINVKYKSISELNVTIIKWILKKFKINTKISFVEDFNIKGTKTDKLINVLKKVNAKCYLSGPAGKNYIENEKFKKNNISLEYKSYEYYEYPQLYNDFLNNLSILDLIFNCGFTEKKYLKSLKKNKLESF